MKNYMYDYADTVTKGLNRMLATDALGAELDVDTAMDTWTEKAKELRDKRGLFFFVGNGASATMAEHLSHDCFQNANMLTQTCAETSHITAVSNDISYEDVFSYRIGKMCGDNDMLIAISSSGNSPNIIKAVETARIKGMYIVTITGKAPENRARKLGDLNFYVPLDTYGLVESAHATLLHCWLDLFLDKYMGGRH